MMRVRFLASGAAGALLVLLALSACQREKAPSSPAPSSPAPSASQTPPAAAPALPEVRAGFDVVDLPGPRSAAKPAPLPPHVVACREAIAGFSNVACREVSDCARAGVSRLESACGDLDVVYSCDMRGPGAVGAHSIPHFCSARQPLPGCQPFTIDDRGRKHYDPHCL